MTTLTSSETNDPKPEGTPAPEGAQSPAAETTTPAAEAAESAAESAEESASPDAAVGDGVDVTTDEVPAGGASTGGFLAPAAALVGAGLGVSSLSGTALSDMLRSREEIIGQIASATGAGGDQVDVLYGAPWETAAIVNGVFALIAVLIGAGVLAVTARNAATRPWIKAVALACVVVGVLGLFVAGGMYFDLFGSQPTLPQQPMMPGPG